MDDDEIFESHQLKCRICFKFLNSPANTIPIDSLFQEQFQDFTGIELKTSSFYSNKVCAGCDNEIKGILEFRDLLRERQVKFYELYPDHPDVKTEVFNAPDFIISEVKAEQYNLENVTFNAQFTSNKSAKSQQPKVSLLKPTVSLVNRPPKNLRFVSPRIRLPKPIYVEGDGIRLPHVTYHTESVFLQPEYEMDIQLKTEIDESSSEPAIVPKPQAPKPGQSLLKRTIVQSNQPSSSSQTLPQSLPMLPPLPMRPIYQCNLCSYETQSPIAHKLIRLHMKRVHFKHLLAEKRIFTCDYCGKELKHKKSLRQHVITEAEKRRPKDESEVPVEKPPEKFICKHCNAEFPAKNKLNSHKGYYHPAIRRPTQVWCDLCPKTYSSKKAMREHMQTRHANLDPNFLCQYCSEKFVTQKALYMHVKKHEDKMAAPVQCPHCDHKCKKHRMTLHIQTYHEGMRFKCVYKGGCNALICGRKDLIFHLTRVHDITEKSDIAEYRKIIKDHKPIFLSPEEMEAGRNLKKKKRQYE